jgi:predicted  nucleic acid-binding Zn-ribbon protein
MSETYDRDFYAWANEQASLLRAGRLAEADIAHIAEEIESMGKTEKRELVSRLTVLLLHLLKWRFQADRAGNSWRLSIANSRDQIEDHLEDNPSLKSELPRTISQAYRYARRDAARETDLRESIFPTTCPWTFEQMMDPDFWPGEAGS